MNVASPTISVEGILALKQAQTQQAAGVSVMKKAMDTVKDQGEMLTAMMEKSTAAMTAATGKGAAIDTYA